MRLFFFLNEMLKSFALAIEEAGSMEDCGTIISKCAVDNGGTENG